MKKTYSDPLMLPHIFLDGIVVGPSQDDSMPPNNPPAKAQGLVGNGDSSKRGADVQIVDPEKNPETKITDSAVASVIDQIMQEDTEITPSDDSSLAD